jgi:predicted transcriptional regulator
VTTRNGERGIAIVSVEDFELPSRRADRAAFGAAMEEADADIAAGRVVDHSAVMAKFREAYGADEDA